MQNNFKKIQNSCWNAKITKSEMLNNHKETENNSEETQNWSKNTLKTRDVERQRGDMTRLQRNTKVPRWDWKQAQSSSRVSSSSQF